MSKKYTRERLFREQWLPAAGVSTESVVNVPLTLLLDLYASVYYLGPAGLLVERQLAVFAMHKDEQTPWRARANATYQASPATGFHKDLDNLRHAAARVLSNNSMQQYHHLVRGQRKLPYPDLPHTTGYLEYLHGQDRYPLHYRADIGVDAAFDMFISISANLTRLRKRSFSEPNLGKVLLAYREFCTRWQIPMG